MTGEARRHPGISERRGFRGQRPQPPEAWIRVPGLRPWPPGAGVRELASTRCDPTGAGLVYQYSQLVRLCATITRAVEWLASQGVEELVRGCQTRVFRAGGDVLKRRQQHLTGP